MKVISAKECKETTNFILVEIEDRGIFGVPKEESNSIYKQIIDRGIEIEPADD